MSPEPRSGLQFVDTNVLVYAYGTSASDCLRSAVIWSDS